MEREKKDQDLAGVDVLFKAGLRRGSTATWFVQHRGVTGYSHSSEMLKIKSQQINEPMRQG
ncbi:hypothetical protein DV515_00010028 [Chloebia gouldiae]|uniref:Uncharacterized protein n=1 Tax=Chloebia gouldiae TaxID=44316 RepID=A0A3L8SAP1_CHLGU|nr:hypothetical protein DV515_00010028 [Chloebia gouldiae]